MVAGLCSVPNAYDSIGDITRFIDVAPPMPILPAAVLSADKPWRTDLLPEAAKGGQVTFVDWLAGQ